MSTPSRLAALTGLRFPAAMAVAACHLGELTHNPEYGPIFRHVCGEGAAGVPFFFVLSGFVLAYSYRDRLARPAAGAVGAYYRSRFARIWPLHLFALGFALLTPYHTVTGGAGPLLAQLFLVQSWVPDLGYVQAYNQITWTLSIEVFFYLTLPLFLRAACRTDAGPRRLALLAALAWLGPAGFVAWHAADPGPWSVYLCTACPVVRFGEFASGAFLALAFHRSGGPDRGPVSGRTRARWTLVEAAAVLLVIAAVRFSTDVPYLLRLNGYYTPAFALLVAVFARGRGRVSGLMAARPAVFLGEVSFAFFLLHPAVFHAVRLFMYYVVPFELRPGWTAQAGLLVAVALLAAVAAHKLVEVRAREWLLGGPGGPRPTLLGRLGRRLRRLVGAGKVG
jgi:peptidoglycan/LPS O-acetylase OafA/YrhL